MGHGLRFHLVAVAAHVSQQVGPVDRGMSLDAKKLHRGTAFAAFWTATPFGPGWSLSGHVAVLGLDGCVYRWFARRAACSPLRARSYPRCAGSVSAASQGPEFK